MTDPTKPEASIVGLPQKWLDEAKTHDDDEPDGCGHCIAEVLKDCAEELRVAREDPLDLQRWTATFKARQRTAEQESKKYAADPTRELASFWTGVASAYKAVFDDLIGLEFQSCSAHPDLQAQADALADSIGERCRACLLGLEVTREGYTGPVHIAQSRIGPETVHCPLTDAERSALTNYHKFKGEK